MQNERLKRLPSGIRFSLPGDESDCTDFLDPLPSYEAGSSLCVSYEIYNLRRGRDNVSRYRMTWSVVANDERDGPPGTWDWIKASATGSMPERHIFISSSMERTSDTRSTRDDIALDAGSLEPGRYLLLLEAEDLDVLITGEPADVAAAHDASADHRSGDAIARGFAAGGSEGRGRDDGRKGRGPRNGRHEFAAGYSIGGCSCGV